MITAREYTELSRAYPFLLEPSLSPRQATQAEGWRVTAAPGQRLFGLHDRCHAFLMIMRRVVRVTKPTLAGRDSLLYRLAPPAS